MEAIAARYQVQSCTTAGGPWIDEVTCAYSQRDRNLAIARARVVEADARVFREVKLTRVVRIGWFTGQIVVWTSY